jgi:O-antigen ligase
MFYDFFARNQSNIKKTVGVFLFVTLVISLAGVLTAAYSIMSGVPVYKQLGLWLMGSNALGGLLCYSMPILLTAGLSLVSRKGIKLLFGAVMLLALFFSFARTSWVGTLAAIAFLLWRGGMKRPIWFSMVTSLIIAAWLFPIVGEDFFQYIAGDRYTGRKVIWTAAWNMACDHPLFGVGPGNAILFMGQYLPEGFVDILGVVDTHSLYLRNAAEMGFPSVVIWLAVFVLVVYNSIKIEGNMDSGFLRLLCRGATATFVAISVRGMGENGSFLTAFSAGEFFVIVPYMALAMPFAAKKLEEKRQNVR